MIFDYNIAFFSLYESKLFLMRLQSLGLVTRDSFFAKTFKCTITTNIYDVVIALGLHRVISYISLR